MNDKRKRFIRNRKAFILAIILFIGVGLALISSRLSFTGNTSIKGNKWSVYFNSIDITEGSVNASVVPTIVGTSTTSLEYVADFEVPGDFYEFIVEAKNDGSIDAMIDSIILTDLDSNIADCFSYTATYLDGTAIAEKDVLKKNTSVFYKVRLEYVSDENIFENDEDDTELTLSFGVNYVQSTVKPSDYINLVKDSAISDSGINFGQNSSASNGRGLYVMNSTTEDNYPIYYYRGNVSNNNALFAGYCWKIVRTTETGGTKLIYNGTPTIDSFEDVNSDIYTNITNDPTIPYVFDNSTSEWVSQNHTNSSTSSISFSLAEAGDFVLYYDLNSESTWDKAFFYRDNNEIDEPGGKQQGYIELLNVSPSTVIRVEYSKLTNPKIENESVRFKIKKIIRNNPGCYNTTGKSTQLALTSSFNPDTVSLAYFGYMYGTVYPYAYNSNDASHKYGATVSYNSSSGMYTLNNTQDGIDNYHHYTCLSSSTSCESVYYVYNASGNVAYHITLSNGKTVEDAVAEMNTNTNDSTIKTKIDDWFNSTIKTYFTNKSKNYNDYIEDTIWCNDRSWNTIDLDGTGKYNDNGWNPDGGSTINNIWSSAYGRINSGTPNLACPNKNDAFTVEESSIGNGALTYPIGLLTVDEINLAGGNISFNAQPNTDVYLYTDESWWTLSPSSLFINNNIVHYAMGSYVSERGTSSPQGVRPSISLRSDVKVEIGGNGSAAKPYVFIVE